MYVGYHTINYGDVPASANVVELVVNSTDDFQRATARPRKTVNKRSISNKATVTVKYEPIDLTTIIPQDRVKTLIA